MGESILAASGHGCTFKLAAPTAAMANGSKSGNVNSFPASSQTQALPLSQPPLSHLCLQ
jgi:hypothetical protein